MQLVGMLQQRLEETQRPSFESTCVLANPEAIRQNRRYVSVDLHVDSAILEVHLGGRCAGDVPPQLEVVRAVSSGHS